MPSATLSVLERFAVKHIPAVAVLRKDPRPSMGPSDLPHGHQIRRPSFIHLQRVDVVIPGKDECVF